MTETANNPFAQTLFDCRDILLPKGPGKGSQRRRSDLRNIVLTIATQGDYEDNSSNGLWWGEERLSTTLGIGHKQLDNHLRWLTSVGLVKALRRFNAPTIYWIDAARLREITQRQQDDRREWEEAQVQAQERGERGQRRWDPAGLEAAYFPPLSHPKASQETN